MNVVIVESPAKAKSINKYLGSGFKVFASYGHVRDLPSKNGSVEPDDNFKMIWEADGQSQKRLNDIAKAVKGSDKLILATDPDREGEAISWHVLEVLKDKNVLKDVHVERVVFNAITKKSVLEAMDHPRGLDIELIDAYLARRALDYLVGFTLSPVLWRKLPGSRSAGRVQSVALRIICDRELEIEKFIAREYWSVEAALKSAGAAVVSSRLYALDGKKLDKFDLATEDDAKRAVTAIEKGGLTVASVEAKPTRRNPQPPFTTSTLQQEAARKLGFTAKTTMQMAQRLYEGIEIGGETTGLITYMRTDGVEIIPEVMPSIRDLIKSEYGGSYCPDAPRVYKAKAKNAQEAHEAIRPTDIARLPKEMRSYLPDDQVALYDLIWKRTMASQMESARMEQTTVDMTTAGGEATLRATGQVVLFDGFLKLYQESKDDTENGDSDEKRLPKLTEGEALSITTVDPNQHFTQPPPRFTEASLVKKLEELGIGRPSTFASTLSTLRDRDYVRMDRTRFIPEDKGRLVTAFLESFFNKFVQYDFTANLEERLDDISAGKLEWKSFLKDFWTDFIGHVDEIKDLRITAVLDALNEVLGPHVFPAKEDGSNPRGCPTCDEGILSLKVGKFGAFVGCSNYPDCKFTRQLNQSNDEAAESGDKILGYHPDTGDEILLKSGRFGPYVEQAASGEDEKPKRSSIPRTYAIDDVDIDLALKLLELPRLVGMHPSDGEEIRAGIGRYGPFVLHNGKYANLETPEEVFTVGINRAVTVLAEKKTRGRGGPKILKELGKNPDTDLAIQVMDGRFGPYVTSDKVNATLPRGMQPEAITLEQAVELINAKIAKGPTKRKAKKKAPKKKAAKKKTAKKAAKKKTAKKATKKKAAKKKTAKKAAAKKDEPQDQAAD